MEKTESHIQLIEGIAKNAPKDGLSLGVMLAQLNDRAFGAMLFLLAMPCAIPFLYGVPQVVALPMLFLSGQVVMGRSEPWLPEKFKNRIMSYENLERAASISRKWFGWTEIFVSPRLEFLSSKFVRPIIGLCVCVFCASILVPLPLTNSVPAVAVAIVAVGLLARDGLFILLGILIGSIWVGALAYGGELLVRTSIDWIKAWLGMGG